ATGRSERDGGRRRHRGCTARGDASCLDGRELSRLRPGRAYRLASVAGRTRAVPVAPHAGPHRFWTTASSRVSGLAAPTDQDPLRAGPVGPTRAVLVAPQAGPHRFWTTASSRVSGLAAATDQDVAGGPGRADPRCACRVILD